MKERKRTLVPGIPVLKAMAKAGLIKLHSDTGKRVGHWTGQTVTAYYIDDVCDGVQQPFTHDGRQYRLKFFDGCFYPFVVDIEFAKTNDIDLDGTITA